MLEANDLDKLNYEGFLRVSNYINALDIQNIKGYMSKLEQFYSEANLMAKRVYLSDKSSNRISHAHMMCTSDHNLLPAFHMGPSHDYHVISRLLEQHHKILGQLFKIELPHYIRSLVNFQVYKSGSKPVPWHFDGEYLDYETSEGIYGFKIKEALLPKYVAVIVVANDDPNHKGMVLKNVKTKQEIAPPSHVGDLIIFNNIQFRHSVPELNHGRVIIGFRCFDFAPYHFLDKPPLVIKPSDWKELPDEHNPGYIKQLVNPHSIIQNYLQTKWLDQFQQAKEDGAVF